MAGNTKKTNKRPVNRFRIVVILFFVIIAVAGALVGALIYLRHRSEPISNPKLGQFAVQSIMVEGNTQYDDNAIIGESGLKVGQSVFSVNKGAAAKKIKETFPYAQEVRVKSPTFNTLTIEITETPVLGAMYRDGNWLLVGGNGKIVETMPMHSDRPFRYLFLQGVIPAEGGNLGDVAMDARSIRVVETVMQSIETYKVEGILGIDMRDKTNIILNWKNVLDIKLGNESNLAAEIELIAKSLPMIIERNGGSVEGVLDVSSYSDNNEANDKIIYTPKDILANE